MYHKKPKRANPYKAENEAFLEAKSKEEGIVALDNGVLFGLICDNNMYVKVTEAGEAVLEDVELRPPYEGAKDYFYIDNVDDKDYLEDIIKATLPELLSPKAKSRKQSMKNRQVPTSLDEIIAPDLVCSQDLRAFFQSHLGKSFRFKVGFQNWLHRNAGLTYRDAVEAYRRLSAGIFE